MQRTENYHNNKEAILKELQRGGRLTVASVFQKLRTLELRHYVAQLRKEGVNILGEWKERNGKRFKEYRLA